MNVEAFTARRAHVLAKMAARGGGVAVLQTSGEAMRNADAEYPYRHGSNFYYLSGFEEPDSVLVLVASDSERKAILFCREKNPAREIWDGYRFGPEAARDAFEFDAAYAIEEWDAQMPALLANAASIFYSLGSPLQIRVGTWLEALRAQSRSGVRAPYAAVDLSPILAEMRVIKEEQEITLMRRAAKISSAAHARAMRNCRPGMHEYEIEAELLHEFRRQGAQAPAYNSIVAAGANTCVLHYRAGNAVLENGALCLIDAGCELDSYASDITRTFPVNGRFSGAQRAVYEIVLAAQLAAIGSVHVGQSFNAPHLAAVRVLAQGMIDLGLVSGSLDAAIESGAYSQFYMHRTSHWLGLDVHDAGDYRAAEAVVEQGRERPWRALAPGMVLTVEPGLYIRPGAGVPEHLQHIGMRIEDDVLVTATGREVLSCDAPKSVDEIEALMSH